MPKALNVILSGLGRISWDFHLPFLTKDPRFHLLAVADPLDERRQEALAAHPELRVYDDFKHMCEMEKTADLAVLASPTLFHREQAEYAMRRNIAVFMEKPMCESYVSARAVLLAAKETSCRIMVYQPHRVRGEFLTFQSSVRGKLGRIFHSRRSYATFNRRNDWQSRRACGGGMLNNYGAHYIDQFLAAFGPGPVMVQGVSLKHTVGIGDAEDLVNVLLQTRTGITGAVDINLGSAFDEDSWTVWGEFGTAHWTNASKVWKLRRVEPGTLPKLTLQEGLAAQNRSYSLEGEIPWIEETVPVIPVDPAVYYDHVYEYFAEGGEPFLPLEESAELIRILSECRKNAYV